MIGRLLRRNPPLLALYVVATAWIAWFATKIHVYFVMPDEARYVKQAIAIASSFRPLLPGDEQFATWSQVQPLLLAPLWGIFQTPTAYALSHVLNAFVIASAVFPAYLLARRVLASHRWALVAAALVVVVPWTVMAGVMMTEVSAYPLSIWALYGIQRAAVQPSTRHDLLALGLVALAFFGRTQLIVLAGVLPVVLLAQRLRYPEVGVGRPTQRMRSALRAHPLIFGAVALVALVLLVRARTIIGNAPEDLFSSGWTETAREMLSYIVIGVGMVPLALGLAWAVGTLARPSRPEAHAFALIALLAGFALTLITGGGSVAFTAGINDRYLAYLVPILMVAMLACLLEPRRWRVLIVAASLASAWVVWDAILEQVGPTFVSPSAAWHLVLYGRAPEIGGFFGFPALTSPHLMGAVVVVAGALIALARTWVRPGVVAGVVALLVGAYSFAETTYTRDKLVGIQPAAGYADGRDWVDRTLPYGAQAEAVLSNVGGDPETATATWWDLTFWNGQVSKMGFIYPGPNFWPDQAFSLPFELDEETGAITGLGETGYVVQAVADRRFALRGAAMVGEPRNNLMLLQVPPGPVSAAWRWTGPDESGFVPAGGEGTVRIFADGIAGRRPVWVTLGAPVGSAAPLRYEAELDGEVQAGRATVDAPATVTFEVDVPASGYVDVVVRAPRRQPRGDDGERGPGVQLYGAAIAAAAG